MSISDTVVLKLLKIKYFRVDEDVVPKKPEEEKEKRQQIKDQDTTWYHEGPPSLLDARLYITGIDYDIHKIHYVRLHIVYF